MQTIKIEGFHGTATRNVEAILSVGFTANRNEAHWLGQGIYFYTTFEMAMWWIWQKKKSDSGQGCAVVKATLGCEVHEFLDLDTHGGLDRFFKETARLLTEHQHDVSLRFKNTPGQRTRNLCFALDLLKTFCGLKLVANTFDKERPTYGQANIPEFERTFFPLPFDLTYKERQICATDNSVILNKTHAAPPNQN